MSSILIKVFQRTLQLLVKKKKNRLRSQDVESSDNNTAKTFLNDYGAQIYDCMPFQKTVGLENMFDISLHCISQCCHPYKQKPSVNKVSGIIKNLCVKVSLSTPQWLLESRNYCVFS